MHGMFKWADGAMLCMMWQTCLHPICPTGELYAVQQFQQWKSVSIFMIDAQRSMFENSKLDFEVPAAMPAVLVRRGEIIVSGLIGARHDEVSLGYDCQRQGHFP